MHTLEKRCRGRHVTSPYSDVTSQNIITLATGRIKHVKKQLNNDIKTKNDKVEQHEEFKRRLSADESSMIWEVIDGGIAHEKSERERLEREVEIIDIVLDVLMKCGYEHQPVSSTRSSMDALHSMSEKGWI